MYYAYMWVERGEQSAGEHARGHCEYYIYLCSFQIYILFLLLSETQINISFSAYVMCCIKKKFRSTYLYAETLACVPT